MKRIVILIFLVSLFFSCSKKEDQSQLKSEESINRNEIVNDVETIEEQKSEPEEDLRVKKLESYLHEELLYFTWHDNGECFIQKHGEPESNVVKTIDPFNLIGGTVIKYRELSYRAEKVFFAIWENGEEHIWAREIYKDIPSITSTWFGMSSNDLITIFGTEDQRDPSSGYWYWVDEINIQFLFL